MPKDTNQVNDAARAIGESMREANQAVTDSFVTARERNMQFAQGVFENSVEVLRSHAESSRSLVQELSELPDRRQGFLQTLAGSASAAQERNIRLAQSTLQSSNELLQSQVESSRALAQVITAQAQRQQGALQELARESMGAYMNFCLAPFSYYRQALKTAEAIATQGAETAQRISRHGLAFAQRASEQERPARR